MELSILIPTYNDVCDSMVQELARQAATIDGLTWEILVGDDGSTDEQVIAANQRIATLEHCFYLRKNQNIGRAAIRNYLAQSAHYERLLFIDSDMSICREDFVSTYLHENTLPVYGGYEVRGERREKRGERKEMRGNLRYLYEKASERQHTTKQRLRNPNRDFHTSNFMVLREQFLSHPLDERLRHYGYEDVLWGKQLAEAGIAIHHIDNPVVFDRFETNEEFVEKTETALQTLNQFREELSGYSRLLSLADTLRRYHLTALFRWLFRLNEKRWRRNLCGPSPSLHLFNIYKLGGLLNC